MHFRVTSIADEGVGGKINDALVTLEDWLNSSLGDSIFGGSLTRLMIVVFSTEFLNDEGQSHRFRASRLSAITDPSTGKQSQVLALHVKVNPEALLAAPSGEVLGLITKAIAAGLSQKPLRAPKDLEYVRLRDSILASLNVYAGSEA